jgi:hypothetical protein
MPQKINVATRYSRKELKGSLHTRLFHRDKYADSLTMLEFNPKSQSHTTEN